MIGLAGMAGYLASYRLPSPQIAEWMGVQVAPQAPGWIEQVAQYHAFYANETRHLVEVGANERDHIESWIGDRTGISFKVPDLDAQDLSFQGARLLLVNGRPITQLLYLPPEGRAVGICFRPTGRPDSTPSVQDFAGTKVLSWNRDGVACAIAGFEGEASLEPLITIAEEAI